MNKEQTKLLTELLDKKMFGHCWCVERWNSKEVVLKVCKP